MTWKGEIRARGEIDGRDFRNSPPPNLYALLRTRLGAEIRPLENISVFIQLQDSRFFGQLVDFNNVDLHQGYLRVDNFPAQGFSLALGRTELSYGNERVVGVSDWSNVGRSFDGILFRYDHGEQAIDLFTANVVELSVPPTLVTRSSVAGTGSEGSLFSGVHYSNTMLSGHTFNLYAFHEWSHKDTTTMLVDLSRFTLGGLLKGSYAGIIYDGEGAYQLGKQESSDISAFMFLGALGYSFTNNSITAGFDHLSGTPSGSSKTKTFNAPFATAHKSFGIMDYFTNIPMQTYGRGLQDMYVRLVVDPTETFSVSVTGHNFRLAEEYVGRRDLGQEFDMIGTWTYDAHVTFEFGGGGFFPDEILKFQFGGEDPGWWGYATVRARF